MSSALPPEDADALYAIGVDTLHNLVALVVDAVLYTVYFVLVYVAGRILLRRSRNWKSLTAFGILVLMLACDTALVLIDANNAIREVTKTLMAHSPDSIADRYNALALPWAPEAPIYAFMSNLGDVIIIWRAYIFWGGHRERWIMLLPLACLLGSITASILLTYCAAILASDPSVSLGDLVNPPFCRSAQMASYVTTLVTTAVVTLMIGYKTWLYRKEIGSYLRSSATPRTRIEKIMVVLTESGFLFFLFFLSAVVGLSGDLSEREESTPQLAFASTIWTYMTSHILGIYPALIVILVHTQRSYIPGTEFSFSSIQFTHSDGPPQFEIARLSRPRPPSAPRGASGGGEPDDHELRRVHRSRSTLYEGRASDKEDELRIAKPRVPSLDEAV